MFAGAAAFVITDIARDGMLTRPRRRRSRSRSRRDRCPGDRLGGVASLDDIARARRQSRDWPASLQARRSTRAASPCQMRSPRWPVGQPLMRVARVIPCLDVTDGRVVKGTNFVDLRDAGDPVELAARYDAEGADELVFLDITASSDARDTTVDMVYRVAEQVFIPFTVGGGIRTARRRPPHAPRRRRQGQRQHRRRATPRADRRDRRPCSARSAWCARSTPSAADDDAACARVRGVPPRRAHAHRHRRCRMGPAGGGARRRRDPADVDGPRRHQGRIRPRAHASDRRGRRTFR